MRSKAVGALVVLAALAIGCATKVEPVSTGSGEPEAEAGSVATEHPSGETGSTEPQVTEGTIGEEPQPTELGGAEPPVVAETQVEANECAPTTTRIVASEETAEVGGSELQDLTIAQLQAEARAIIKELEEEGKYPQQIIVFQRGVLELIMQEGLELEGDKALLWENMKDQVRGEGAGDLLDTIEAFARLRENSTEVQEQIRLREKQLEIASEPPRIKPADANINQLFAKMLPVQRLTEAMARAEPHEREGYARKLREAKHAFGALNRGKATLIYGRIDHHHIRGDIYYVKVRQGFRARQGYRIHAPKGAFLRSTEFEYLDLVGKFRLDAAVPASNRVFDTDIIEFARNQNDVVAAFRKLIMADKNVVGYIITIQGTIRIRRNPGGSPPYKLSVINAVLEEDRAVISGSRAE